MKHILQLLCLGLCLATLSSCDTYVNGSGYAGTRPRYYNRGPAPHPSHHNPGYNYNNRGYYGNNRPSYYNSRPAPHRVGVNTGLNTPVLNSNTRLGLF